MSTITEIQVLAQQVAKIRKTNQLADCYGRLGRPGSPYRWQQEFHKNGATDPERAIVAANRTGKTRTAAAETAIHLTGLYPDWWEGYRFKAANDWIVAGRTNESIRDIVQLALFGTVDENRQMTGTGWVPRELIGAVTYRPGLTNVLDTVKVKHVSGEWSTVTFKSYEQGSTKFQGTSKGGCWLDEEPDDYGIFTECQTRLIDQKGILLFTNTPLLGMSEIVQHFVDGGLGISWLAATWDDAPHLDDGEKKRLAASYPEHERETRTKGIPMMGTGLVYPIPDEMILCEPFPIPKYYRRIAGTDFGIDHPAAGAWLALDPDADCMYLYDCYSQKGETAAYHAQAFKSRGDWIPVAWPLDGLQRDKGSGVALAEQYRDRGANMIEEYAQWDTAFQKTNAAGPVSREAGNQEILERMRTGRFKVFNTPAGELFLKEKRMLHRKDGIIVPKRDDIESAIRYAVMMIRYAMTMAEATMPATAHTTDYDPLADFSV